MAVNRSLRSSATRVCALRERAGHLRKRRTLARTRQPFDFSGDAHLLARCHRRAAIDQASREERRRRYSPTADARTQSAAMAILSSPWTAVAQLPPATRGLLLSLVAVTVTVAVLRGLTGTEELKRVFRGNQDSLLAFPYLVVVPGKVIWAPWTLLTAGLVEGNIIELVFSGLALFFSGRYLERVWGQVEFIKFCVVVVVASNIGCVALSILEYFVLGDAGTFLVRAG